MVTGMQTACLFERHKCAFNCVIQFLIGVFLQLGRNIPVLFQFSFHQHFNCKTEAGGVNTRLKKDKGGFSNEFEDICSRTQEVLSAF